MSRLKHNPVRQKKLDAEFREYNARQVKLGLQPLSRKDYDRLRAGKLKIVLRGVRHGMEVKGGHRPSPQVPSGDEPWNAAPRRSASEYTGDRLVGIGTMHKSNMVPVFSSDDAEDMARMRRG